jgi:hypothetical protein
VPDMPDLAGLRSHLMSVARAGMLRGLDAGGLLWMLLNCSGQGEAFVDMRIGRC